MRLPWGVCAALEEIRAGLPFALLGIDSDNGSEFINHYLLRWCRRHGVKFTRSRPYRKNDNAHIEQKNWTHVRKIFGWDRYDTAGQCAAMNQVYTEDLSDMMNLFQPCVKLVEKVRSFPIDVERECIANRDYEELELAVISHLLGG